jgi:hypothetical protein
LGAEEKRLVPENYFKDKKGLGEGVRGVPISIDLHLKK